MKIYNLLEGNSHTLDNSIVNEPCFVIAKENQVKKMADLLGISDFSRNTIKRADTFIRFDAREDHDYLNLIYFQTVGGTFEFETFSLVFGKTFLILSLTEESHLLEDFLDDFLPSIQTNDISQLYVSFLDALFSEMFDSLYLYEEILAEIENEIIISDKVHGMEEIVEKKNNCFKVKKYMRLLLYVGDDLILNINNLISEKQMKVVNTLDVAINRLYEFSSNLYETCVHLLEIYDSTVSTRTNDVINKLTVFTVFATPITVLTGIYGMNFENMPELQNPNGYYILLGIMVFISLMIYFILKKIKLL
ncbi:magnesium transporter CorA family protein [Vagococcus elongatus]|nr:CorA family divalent cation transporter [Vagococcus elongatus]